MDDETFINLRIDQPYRSEYARSSWSSCRKCRDEIEVNELRLSKMVQTRRYDDPIPYWYHFECFFMKNNLMSTGDLANFTALRYEDQKRIVVEIEASTGVRAKRVKLEPEIEEALQEQSDLLYSYIGKLQKLEPADLVKLCIENAYDVLKSRTRKIEILADAMVFGACRNCPECQNGQLYFRITGYICSGYVSDGVRCTYETTKPDRKAFKIPGELKESYSFLAKYKYLPLDRVMSQVQEPVEANDFVEITNIPEDESEKIFESRPRAFPQRQTFAIKDRTIVDPQSGLADTAFVYKEGDRIYSEVLINVNLQANKNSYYKIQLLEDKRFENRYWIYTAWGRVGTDFGGYSLEGFSTRLENAKAEFELFFYHKTRNEYCNRGNFVQKGYYYYPVDINYTGNEDEEADEKAKMEISRSALQPALQELMKMIFAVELMKKEMKEFELDTNKMPLGKLSKKQILSAYEVLAEISRLVGDDTKKALANLISQNEKFYTLIPHTFEGDTPPLIRTNLEVAKKLEMLGTLLDIEIAFNMISCAKRDDSNDDLMKHYLQLHADLSVMNTEEPEFKLINTYLTNTQCETHTFKLKIKKAFRVHRHGEEERYKKSIGQNNKMLLWHGSHITNFASILSQGLRIPSPQAPVTGYMFGKGVYFADMSTKSAAYCRVASNNLGLLILCEVALGNMLELTHSDSFIKLPQNNHSVKGVGEMAPDPRMSMKIDEDVVVPCGKGIPTLVQTTLDYNEFVVYDVNQIKIRYLLMVDFEDTQLLNVKLENDL